MMQFVLFVFIFSSALHANALRLDDDDTGPAKPKPVAAAAHKKPVSAVAASAKAAVTGPALMQSSPDAEQSSLQGGGQGSVQEEEATTTAEAEPAILEDTGPDLGFGKPAVTNFGFKNDKVTTTMTAAAGAGDTVLQIANADGFGAGDTILVGDEAAVIASFGSIVLQSPLKNAHAVGTTIVKVVQEEAAATRAIDAALDEPDDQALTTTAPAATTTSADDEPAMITNDAWADRLPRAPPSSSQVLPTELADDGQPDEVLDLLYVPPDGADTVARVMEAQDQQLTDSQAMFDVEINAHSQEAKRLAREHLRAQDKEKGFRKAAKDSREKKHQAMQDILLADRLKAAGQHAARVAGHTANSSADEAEHFLRKAAQKRALADAEETTAVAIQTKVTLYHIDYEMLMGSTDLQHSLSQAIRDLFLKTAGIPGMHDQMDVAFSAGSLRVIASLTPSLHDKPTYIADKIRTAGDNGDLQDLLVKTVQAVPGIGEIAQGTITAGTAEIEIIPTVNKYKRAFKETGCPNQGALRSLSWWMGQEDETVWADMMRYCDKVKDKTASADQNTECCGSPGGCTVKQCTRQLAWLDSKWIDRQKQYLAEAQDFAAQNRNAQDNIKVAIEEEKRAKAEIAIRTEQEAFAKKRYVSVDKADFYASVELLEAAAVAAKAKKMQYEAEAAEAIAARRKSEAREAGRAGVQAHAHKVVIDSKASQRRNEGEVRRLAQEAVVLESTHAKLRAEQQAVVLTHQKALKDAVEAEIAKKEAQDKMVHIEPGRQNAAVIRENKKKAASRKCMTSGEDGSTAPRDARCWVSAEDRPTFQCEKTANPPPSAPNGTSETGIYGWCYTDAEKKQWGSCTPACEDGGRWTLTAKDTFCGPKVRKTLATSRGGFVSLLEQCMSLVADDPDCGDQMYTSGENCVCVMVNKKCDMEHAPGQNLYSYYSVLDARNDRWRSERDLEHRKQAKLQEALMAAESALQKADETHEAKILFNTAEGQRFSENVLNDKTIEAKARSEAESADAAMGYLESVVDKISEVEGKLRMKAAYQTAEASYVEADYQKGRNRLHSHFQQVAKDAYEDAKTRLAAAVKDVADNQALVVELRVQSKRLQADANVSAFHGKMEEAYGNTQARDDAQQQELDTLAAIEKGKEAEETATAEFHQANASYNYEVSEVKLAAEGLKAALEAETQAKQVFALETASLAAVKQGIMEEKRKKLRRTISMAEGALKVATESRFKAQAEADAAKLGQKGAEKLILKIQTSVLDRAYQKKKEAITEEQKLSVKNELAGSKALKEQYEAEAKAGGLRNEEALKVVAAYSAEQQIQRDIIAKATLAKQILVDAWKATVIKPTPWPTPVPTLPPTPYPTRANTPYPTTAPPTAYPTVAPTPYPTPVPSPSPTQVPTPVPTVEPTPVPTTTAPPTPAPTPFPTIARGEFKLSSGDCTLKHDNHCVESPGYPTVPYSSGQTCDLTVSGHGMLKVHGWHVRADDEVLIGGMSYSEGHPPADVKVANGALFQFRPNGVNHAGGFKVCIVLDPQEVLLTRNTYVLVPTGYPQEKTISSYCPAGTTYVRHVCGRGARDWSGLEQAGQGPFTTDNFLGDDGIGGHCASVCDCGNVKAECSKVDADPV